MKSKLVSLSLVTVLGLAASIASADVLMLNFGPAPGVSSVTTNSPYHTAAGSGFTQSHWNTVGTADVSSGLLFSDGVTAATGVSVNLGASTTSTINLSSQPGTSSALGTASNAGIYLNNDIAKSGIFSGNASSNNSVGVQIGGLSAGTYDIYITARNTNTGQQANNGYTQAIYVGTSATSGNFDFSTYTTTDSLVYASNQAPATYLNSAWVEGENYVKLSISITAGQFLNLAVDGINSGGSGDTRGFLNSVQIVNTTTVPEPSAFAALAGLGALGMAGLRRRSRR